MGELYQYEYWGQSIRLAQYDYSYMVFNQLQRQSLTILANADEQCSNGITSLARDFCQFTGKYVFAQKCTDQLNIKFLTQIIKGACVDGSGLLLEKIDELTPETLSIVSCCIEDIRTAIQKRELKVSVDGQVTKLLKGMRLVATVSDNAFIGRSHSFQQLFAFVSVIKPNARAIIQMSLQSIGFQHHAEMAMRLSQMFKFLRSGFIAANSVDQE